ncbi:hypothetical protein NP233_g4998 [Leucocoprinus birnbaumii]|uniref:Uncharacterized protein n=1 Tax=Leucocoprinus birnbaumii TaxID=56174 RepID=A0AAD5VWC9_9AGAR|nr:hypothetical protein NP233_g4998 [Leucocoprinus birnbaumii]
MQSDPFAFYTAFQVLQQNNIPYENFLRRSFEETSIASSPEVENLVKGIENVLDLFLFNKRTQPAVESWIRGRFTEKLKLQLADASRVGGGFHFTAKDVTAEKLKETTIQKLENGIKDKAPDVWHLVGELLKSDPEVIRRRHKAREEREKTRKRGKGQRKRKKRGNIAEGDDELRVLDIVDSDEDEPEDVEEQLEERWRTQIRMACGVPDQARKFIAQIGLSVSVSTINLMVKNLSAEAAAEIRRLGSTFLVSYGYDNWDFLLRHSTPTWETTRKDDLEHLSTGAIFPMVHGPSLADLDYSDFLWNLQKNPPPPATIADIAAQMPPEIPNENGLRPREQFIVWKFLFDLVNYGPTYFSQFKAQLGEPEEFECIPVIKSHE